MPFAFLRIFRARLHTIDSTGGCRNLEAETMSDHTKDCCENNVACDVSNCAYNADGKRCHADHIQVKNTQGTCTCKDETFCSTFTKKGSAAF
jgi:hypothetical protein